MERTTTKGRAAGGRPPKFSEPSGPVTVTLPYRTLDQLRSLHPDRAKAIVEAVDRALGHGGEECIGAEVIEMGSGVRLLTVPSNESLDALPWLEMIEVAPGRCLLAIASGTPIERIEVSLMDAIDEARDSAPADVPLLETLAEKIRDLRRGRKVSLAEVLVVTP